MTSAAAKCLALTPEHRECLAPVYERILNGSRLSAFGTVEESGPQTQNLIEPGQISVSLPDVLEKGEA